MKKRKIFLGFAIAAAAVLGLASCGNDDETGKVTNQTQQASGNNTTPAPTGTTPAPTGTTPAPTGSTPTGTVPGGETNLGDKILDYNFNSATTIEKKGLSKDYTWGTKGIYSAYSTALVGSNAGTEESKNYAAVEDGAVVLHNDITYNADDQANTKTGPILYADFGGDITDGVITASVKIKPSDANMGGITMVQVYGSDATKTNSEIFGLRGVKDTTDKTVSRMGYRVDGGTETAPVDTSLLLSSANFYEVKLVIDLKSDKITATIDDKTIAESTGLGITSIKGLRFVGQDGGNKTMTIDDLVVYHKAESFDVVKANVIAKLDNEYNTKYKDKIATDYKTNGADLTKIYTDAKDAITKATDSATVNSVYSKAVSDMAKVLTDAQIAIAENSLLSYDFNTAMTIDKIGIASGYTWGTKGIYSAYSTALTGSNAGTEDTKNYAAVENGALVLHNDITYDKNNQANTKTGPITYVDFGGDIYDGVVDTTFKIKTSDATMSGITMVQFYGTDSTKTNSEIFAIRGKDDNKIGYFGYRVDGGTEALPADKTAPIAANTFFEMHVVIDIVNDKVTATANGKTICEVTGSGITSVKGLRFVGQDGGNKTITIDDLVVAHAEEDAADFKTRILTKLASVYDTKYKDVIATNYTNNGEALELAFDTGKNEITGAEAKADIIAAYTGAVKAMAAVLTDAQVALNAEIEAKIASLPAADAYTTNATVNGKTYNNTNYATVLEEVTATLKSAKSLEDLDTKFTTEKAKLDAIKNDTAILDEAIEDAIDYIDNYNGGAKNYTFYASAYAAAQNAAKMVAMELTFENATDVYANIDAAFEGVSDDSKIDSTTLIINMIDTLPEATVENIDKYIQVYNEYSGLDAEAQATITNAATLATKIEAMESAVNLFVENEFGKISVESSTEDIEAALEAIYDIENDLAALDKNISSSNLANEAIFADELLKRQAQPVIEMIADLPTEITHANKASVKAAREAYNALSSEVKAKVTNLSALETAEAAVNALPQAGFTITFTESNKANVSDTSVTATVSGNLKSGVTPKTYNDVTYNSALKMESSTSISFTLTGTSKITLVTDLASKGIKVNDVKKTSDADGIVVLEDQTGTITITKGDSCNIFAIIVE